MLLGIKEQINMYRFDLFEIKFCRVLEIAVKLKPIIVLVEMHNS